MEDQNDNESSVESQGQDVGAQDPIKNIKSEFTRKFENVTEQLRMQSEMLQRTLDQMQASKAAPAGHQQSQTEEIDPIVDPVRYKQAIKEEAKREMRSEIQLSQATQNEVMRLQSVYPEFGENGSEAAKLALSKFSTLPAHLKGTPEGAKLVLMETAAELGLTPASRRRKAAESEDDYTVSGSSGSSRQRSSSSQNKLDNKTLAFAELMGLDISNPETRKSLEARAQRKTWSKYE